MLYLCRVKPLRHYLRGFLIAAWAGDKIAEFSFPEISFHFSLRPWFFFVSPAYAGKSDLTSGTQTLLQGSPPHVRGKASRLEYTTRRCRITPACAGKRGQGIARDLTDRDHPRMCGEKVRGAWLRNWRMGSPPHVRGKAELSSSILA